MNLRSRLHVVRHLGRVNIDALGMTQGTHRIERMIVDRQTDVQSIEHFKAKK